MKKTAMILATAALCVGVFMGLSAAAEQTTTTPSTAQNPAVAPGATQTTTARPTAPAQDPTAPTTPIPAPPAQSKEDKSVNANKQAQQAQLPQSDASVASLDSSGLTSAQLQEKIQAALASEPTLSGTSLNVNVTDDEIVVTGTVGTGKERTTASRIVQSFGENRKVKEKINVSGVKK